MGWSGPLGSASPSMVVTLAPSICQTKTVQAFTALPSTCTTQAPHWDVSQPTWVPVNRRFSRRNCTRSVRGSTSPVTALPFTVSATADMTLLLEIRPKTSFFAPTGETDGGSGQNRVDFAPGHGLEQVDSEPAAQGRSRVCGDRDLGAPDWGACDLGARRRRHPGCVTAAANLTKKSSAVFFAALLMRRCPSWASLPPICASTS